MEYLWSKLRKYMLPTYSHPLTALYETTYVGESDGAKYFRRDHGKTLNSMNGRYMLPVDEDEIRVCLAVVFLCLWSLKFGDVSDRSITTA
jgi:hypothetical protein